MQQCEEDVLDTGETDLDLEDPGKEEVEVFDALRSVLTKMTTTSKIQEDRITRSGDSVKENS